MVYFEPNTGWPEQLGKIMGDAFAAAMVVSVLVLVTSSMRGVPLDDCVQVRHIWLPSGF